jgi:OOP family OmpA-OmpF porin
MSDSPLRIVPTKPSDTAQPEGAASEREELASDELVELRRLLVEPEQVQIKNILERLNNPKIRARELSRSLPEAIRLRSAKDESITEALSPAIVSAFHSSIKKDPRPVAEAISPLMGPAIRRAIASTINALLQSFDQTLKHSLSWRGMKWRLEAIRTGKPFAEVVLYHTLVYRVEQVFLIHKRTGLLLQHVAADAISAKDADIVSGMLTAIQDAIRNFARDSFDAGQDEPIEKLDLGDREVWFEPGPHAVLAAVIRGNAPESLRSDFFAPTIETIHLEMRETLESFDGDAEPFGMIRHHLDDCLQSRFQTETDPKTFRVPGYLWLTLALLLGAIAVWAYFTWREQRRWNDYIETLRATPGIVITEIGTRNGKHFVAGLRDPLTVHPDEILKQKSRLAPETVVSRWERYQAFDPQFVLERAKNLLKPPPGVEMKIENGSLRVGGAAPHHWIADARKFALAIPGVDAFDDKNLIDADLKEPEILRLQIENRIIRFVMGSSQLVAGQTREFNDLAAEIKKLIALAPTVNRNAHIEIVGHTDSEGGENTNMILSRQRAVRMLALLAARGVNAESMTAIGVGTTEPLRPEISESAKQFNRSVSFKVSLAERGERK